MLSIGLLSLESLDYYLDLAVEDYYLKGGEPPGRWFLNRATKALGLPDTVSAKHLRELYNGYHPLTGEPLVQNAYKKNAKWRRRPGWDLTCSIPKSASCFVTTSIWQTIRSIHDRAVHGTLELLEDTRGVVRRGSGSQKTILFEEASIVAALFEHTVSRELDPQLHTHALLLNLGQTDDGDFGALFSSKFYGKRQRHFLGAYYRSLVAHDLRKDLRLETYREWTSFGIKGVSKLLINKRSKRRKQIKGYMKKEGWIGGAAAAKATLVTRRTKTDIPPREELNKKWAEENEAHGLTERSIRRMQRAKPADPEKDLPKFHAKIIENMSLGRASHFTEIQFEIEALQESVNWGLHPKLVLDGLAELLKTSEGIVSLGTHDKKKRYTTKTILEREQRLLTNVDRLRNATELRIRPRVVKRVLRKYRLTDEQREAVEHLVRSPGCIRLLDGRAGTGKTSVVLGACKEIWKRHGYRVIAAAYTGKAAVELEEATAIPTETIHWRLADFKRDFGFNVRHHLKQLSRAARKKKTYRLKKLKPVEIDRRTILVVDEMSMVNARHWEMLTKRVQRGGGTLIAVGDGRQLPAVEGQSPFWSLCKRIGCAKLRDIVRQKEKWARQVASLMSEGEGGKALAILAERECVHPCEDMNHALDMLVRHWSVRGLKHPEEAPILASTNDELEAINDLCQKARLKAETIGGKSARIIDEDEDGKVLYSSRVFQGDRVLFTKNNRRMRIRNGFTGTVIGVEAHGRSITVQLDNGDRVIVPVKEFKHLRRGYALSVHKSQGGTYPECFVLAGWRQNLPTAYVSLSRAVLATHVYTSKHLLNKKLKNVERSLLAKGMSKTADQRMASDLLETDSSEEPNEETSEEPEDWWESQEQNAETAEEAPPPTCHDEPKGWWESHQENDERTRPEPWWRKQSKPAPRVARETVAHQQGRNVKQSHPKRRPPARREALARLQQELAAKEQERRKRYAMAQAEANRRRKALLTQMFLVSSSVYEPRRTEAGNRELLNSSLTALLRYDDSPAEAITVEESNTPVMNYFLADLFTPPAKELPSTQDVDYLAVEEGVMAESEAGVIVESEAVALNRTIDVPQTQPAAIEAPEPWPQPAEPDRHKTYTWPEPDTYQTSTSSSPLPDYSSSSFSTYQPSTSAFTECQTQSIAMYNFQATGAAQTASMQAATQSSNYYTKNG